MRPDIPGAERAYTLRDVADMDAIVARLDAVGGARPQSAVIVGGGFIGVELAENLTRRGLAVTIVELAPHVLPPLDVEIAAVVEAHLVARGVRVRTDVAAAAVEEASVVLTDGRTDRR